MKIKLLVSLLILLLALPAVALPPKGTSQSSMSAQVDNDTFIDVNRILMFVTNHGNFGRDLSGVFGYDYGTWFPYFGDTSAISLNVGSAGDNSPNYASGLWLGGTVDIGGGVMDTVLCISEYASEYAPGPMDDLGNFMPDIPAYRVYKLYRDSLASNPNEDYLNWPVDQGAPVDSTGAPEMIGDQMLWAVYNGADGGRHDDRTNAGGTDPMGIEVKQTIFGFDRLGSLGNIVFMRYRIKNKSDITYNDFMISLWCDPDLGSSGNDLVGCDTILSLGYVYNNDPTDNQYPGKAPPAMGFDFFQGPLQFTGNDADTARMWGQLWPQYTNLGMVSFNKYINGTDPDNYQQTFQYMNGLDGAGDGAPYVYNGDTLLYFHSGDPTAPEGQRGDIDFAPADRRWMQTTGPIVFAPGDSTEILAAMIVGQGGDRLNSITIVKALDDFAQRVYENNFNPPAPPAKPLVRVGEMPGIISLSWDDTSEVDPGDFVFEGYTVWQGQSPSGPWEILQTFDLDNDVRNALVDTLLDANSGLPLATVMRPLKSTGLSYHYTVTEDKIGGGPLRDAMPYYFRVTAFSFAFGDTTNGGEFVPAGDRFLESQTQVQVIPKAPSAGTETPFTVRDTLPFTHAAGGSNGAVYPLIMDPLALTGDTYRVFFTVDTVAEFSVDTTFTYTELPDTCGGEWDADSAAFLIIHCIDTSFTDPDDIEMHYDTSFNSVWNLQNATTGEILLTKQYNQTGDNDYQVVDGMLIKVEGPPFGVVAIDEVAGAGGAVIDPPDNVMWSLNSTADWYVGSDQSSNFDRLNWRGLIGTYDWEFRFTDPNDGNAGSEYYDWNTDLLQADRAPFEVWNIGIGTPDDAGDDLRINFSFIDDDASGAWSYGDRLYPWEVAYSEPSPAVPPYDFPADFRIGRIVFNDYSEATTSPAPGTVVRFTSAKINTTADTFTFVAQAPEMVASAGKLDDIKVVPNPFYLYGGYDPSPGSYKIQWHHLPDRCTIKIYNLAGDLVKTIDKETPGPLASWDILTEQGLPVSSGIYIWVVDAPGFGTKMGKMAVFVESEVLRIF